MLLTPDPQVLAFALKPPWKNTHLCPPLEQDPDSDQVFVSRTSPRNPGWNSLRQLQQLPRSQGKPHPQQLQEVSVTQGPVSFLLTTWLVGQRDPREQLNPGPGPRREADAVRLHLDTSLSLTTDTDPDPEAQPLGREVSRPGWSRAGLKEPPLRRWGCGRGRAGAERQQVFLPCKDSPNQPRNITVITSWSGDRQISGAPIGQLDYTHTH